MTEPWRSISHERPRGRHRNNHHFQGTARRGAAGRWDKHPIHAMSSLEKGRKLLEQKGPALGTFHA